MNIQELLKRLERNEGRFPREAVEEAITARDQIFPELLNVIEYTKQNVNELAQQGDYMAHIYAMYLLAQFREQRAYPVIIDLFSGPDDVTVDMTGDMVTEALDRILASVSHGDTSLMERLVEDEEVNEYVRAAAMDGMVVSVACGQKPREEVMAYYQSLFRGKFRREPSFAWASLVSSSTDLYPEEVYDDIKQAFNDHLVDEIFVDFPWVEETLERGQEGVLQELREDKKHSLIENTIDEMQWWACFNTPEPVAVRSGRKIGRNERCPCGSGKKYKKCCGRVGD